MSRCRLCQRDLAPVVGAHDCQHGVPCRWPTNVQGRVTSWVEPSCCRCVAAPKPKRIGRRTIVAVASMLLALVASCAAPQRHEAAVAARFVPRFAVRDSRHDDALVIGTDLQSAARELAANEAAQLLAASPMLLSEYSAGGWSLADAVEQALERGSGDLWFSEPLLALVRGELAAQLAAFDAAQRPRRRPVA